MCQSALHRFSSFCSLYAILSPFQYLKHCCVMMIHFWWLNSSHSLYKQSKLIFQQSIICKSWLTWTKGIFLLASGTARTDGDATYSQSKGVLFPKGLVASDSGNCGLMNMASWFYNQNTVYTWPLAWQKCVRIIQLCMWVCERANVCDLTGLFYIWL